MVGPNTAGKTNLLEAVMVACTGSSFRAKDVQLIQNTKEWARIDVHTSQNELRTIKIQKDLHNKTKKTYEIDDKSFTRLSIDKKQPVVLFEPNNLQLIEGEPTLRREYLDALLEQSLPGYSQQLAQYRRVLAQRNRLLKQDFFDEKQLFAWNVKLVELAEKIALQRQAVISVINNRINQLYQSISTKNKHTSVAYISTVQSQNYGSQLLQLLERDIDKDRLRGFTSHGPHRDDMVVCFGSDPALHTASRGELRTLVLTLKILELQLLEDRRGVRPTLLLDDVFSELDGGRRKALTDFLKDHQTILTTTDADIAVAHFSTNSNVIAIS